MSILVCTFDMNLIFTGKLIKKCLFNASICPDYYLKYFIIKMFIIYLIVIKHNRITTENVLTEAQTLIFIKRKITSSLTHY